MLKVQTPICYKQNQNVRVQALSSNFRLKPSMKLQCRSSLTFKVPINRSVKVCSSQSNKGDQKHVAKTIVIVSAGGNDGSGATSSGNPLTGGSGNHPLRFWAYFFAVFLFRTFSCFVCMFVCFLMIFNSYRTRLFSKYLRSFPL